MPKRSPSLILCQTEIKFTERNFLPRKGMYFLRISNLWEISMVNVDRRVCTLDPTASTFSHSRAEMMTHPLGGTLTDSAIPNESHPPKNLKNLGWIEPEQQQAIKKLNTGFDVVLKRCIKSFSFQQHIHTQCVIIIYVHVEKRRRKISLNNSVFWNDGFRSVPPLCCPFIATKPSLPSS